MAKLSAHGKELVRLVKILPDSEYFTENKKTVALMEDRRILTKHTGRMKPDQYNPNPGIHSWGWKRGNKLKEGITVEQFIEGNKKLGYVVE